MALQNRLKLFFQYYLGFFTFAIAVLLFKLGQLYPELIQTYYLEGFYKSLQWFHFLVFSNLPFDLTDVFLVFLLISILRKFISKKKKLKHKTRFLQFMNKCCCLAALFLALWGFNYAGDNFQNKAKFQAANEPPNFDFIKQRCLDLRESISAEHFEQKSLSLSDIQAIDKCINQLFKADYPEYVHNATIKQISKSGWLRRAGISGIYFPFTLQGHLDVSYTRHQLIFTCAHELSHAHGITDEGEANLIAYLGLINSDNDEFKFAAEFTLLRYIAKDSTQLLNLPAPLANDYSVLQNNRKLFPLFFPQLSAASNNLYLKIMGVEEGIESYNQFPLLLQGYNIR